MEEIKKRYAEADFDLNFIIIIAGSLFLLFCGAISRNPLFLVLVIAVIAYSFYKFKKKGAFEYELDSQGVTILNKLSGSNLLIPYENIKAVHYSETMLSRRVRGYKITIRHGPVSENIYHTIATTIFFVMPKKQECFDFLNALGEKIGKEKIINFDQTFSNLEEKLKTETSIDPKDVLSTLKK